MEQQPERHTGVIESFELEDPSWPVITPKAKGKVRAAFDSNLYDLNVRELMGMEHLLPFVGLRISFDIFVGGGKKIAGNIRFESWRNA